MADVSQPRGEGEVLDVRHAAALVGRHPETIRRWVWSGRLAARRHRNRLLIARADVEALVASEGRDVTSLSEWARRARAGRKAGGGKGSGRSAADLVIEDRTAHSPRREARARR